MLEVFKVNQEQLSIKEIVQISRQLSYCIKLSVPLPEALKQIEQSCPDKRLAQILKEVCDKIKKGKGLGESFTGYTHGVFSKLLSFGEKQHQLQKALVEVISHYEAQDKLEEQIKTTLFYPSIVFVGALILWSFFVFFVWGRVAPFILQLPLPLWLADFYKLVSVLDTRIVFIPLLFVTAIFLFYVWKKKLFYPIFLSFSFLYPSLRKMYLKACKIKIYRVLSLLLGMNYPLRKAIACAKEVSTLPEFSTELSEIDRKIAGGSSLQKAISESKELHTWFLGTENDSGSLVQDPAEALNSASELLEKELSLTSQIFLAYLEPFMIAAAGVVVLFAICAFWFPFYHSITYFSAP